jgi:hypothetical protein
VSGGLRVVNPGPGTYETELRTAAGAKLPQYPQQKRKWQLPDRSFPWNQNRITPESRGIE